MAGTILGGSFNEDTRTEKEKMVDHHNRLIRMYDFDLMKAYRENDWIKQKYYKEEIKEQREKLKKLEV